MPIQVIVVPHDPDWSARFESESRKVADALGANLVTIHHIGSTAIPTAWAKPIIDMLAEVRDIDAVADCNPAMEAIGYEAMGEFGIAGRRYFRKDNADGIRTHHVHTFAAGSSEAVRHLAFRDFMLAHPDWAQRYSDLKRRLAAACSNDINQYMDGKDAFIKDVERRAAAWRLGQPPSGASA